MNMILPTTGELIPRNRLKNIPKHLRLAHEYCYFVHDECVRVLAEYEANKAGWRTIPFKSLEESQIFQKLADQQDTIHALRTLGFANEAKRTILNQLTMGLTSDLLHHVYEGLSCLERRKSVVALNLLRKPLTDNLVLLAWMLSDEKEFYEKFEAESPSALTPSKTGNIRQKIFIGALEQLELPSVITSELLIDILFNDESDDGLYGFFQHAVHLVTVKRPSIQTTPENLNFLFKNPNDDDIYEIIYSNLPLVLCFAANVVIKLFDRIKSMDEGAQRAFHVRSKLGLMLLYEKQWRDDVLEILSDTLVPHVSCESCGRKLNVTVHNAARLLLAESFRCTGCRRIWAFPFSWLI